MLWKPAVLLGSLGSLLLRPLPFLMPSVIECFSRLRFTKSFYRPTKEPQRVERSVAISIIAYLMLLKFRAQDIPERGPWSASLPSSAISPGRSPKDSSNVLWSNAYEKRARSAELHNTPAISV